MTTTDKQDELLTQVDQNNVVIGPIARGVAHNNPAVYYRTVFVLVKDKAGKVLLQKRSSTKDLYPDCWDLSVGGHVSWGDSYEQTAIKELAEELGITTTFDRLIHKGHVLVKLPTSNEHFEVYEYQLCDDDHLDISTEEVSSTRWMTIDDIKESMATKSLAWYARPEQAIATLY